MGYCRGLDGLRAFAALAVIAFHVGHLRGYAGGGFLGVDIFFVLSGYLISTILLSEVGRTESINISAFWGRRAARLTPALLFFLVVYCMAAPFAFPGQEATAHLRDALLTAFYLSDYGYALYGVPSVLQHTWSLSAEAHFYLAWPIALLAILRSGKPLPILAAAWIMATVWKADVLLTDGWVAGYYRADTRLSGFLAGAALSFILRDGRWKPGGTLVWASLAVLLLVMTTSQFGNPQALIFGGAVSEAATMALIAGVVSGTTPAALRSMLESQGAVAIGRLSYGLYLWHYPIALLVRERFDFVTAILLTGILSTILAALSYLVVETRFRIRMRAGARAMSAKQSAPAL